MTDTKKETGNSQQGNKPPKELPKVIKNDTSADKPFKWKPEESKSKG